MHWAFEGLSSVIAPAIKYVNNPSCHALEEGHPGLDSLFRGNDTLLYLVAKAIYLFSIDYIEILIKEDE